MHWLSCCIRDGQATIYQSAIANSNGGEYPAKTQDLSPESKHFVGKFVG
jgi:hypothetical protein